MSAPRPPADDPDDDLDELDDILDSFAPSPAPPRPSAPTPSAATPNIPPPPSRPAPTPPPSTGQQQSDEDLIAQLLKDAGLDEGELPPLTEEERLQVERLAELFSGMGSGVQGSDEERGMREAIEGIDMEEMMRQLGLGEEGDEYEEGLGAGGIPSASSSGPTAEEVVELFVRETTSTPTTTTTTESTVISTPTGTAATSMTTTTSAPPPSLPTAGPPRPPAPTPFESAIQSTLSRLSQHSTPTPTSGPSSSGDPLADLLAGMGSEEGMGGMEGMQGMLEGMLRQLMSRDVLYDSLKELGERYPPYISDHPSLPAADLTRYEAQQTVIRSLLTTFDDPSYDESDPEWGIRVVEGMNRLQELGSPPKEIMGDMPDLAGLTTGPDGLPRIPGMDEEGCVVM